MTKKFDIREVVTRKIIEGLEAGKLPWAKPWADGMAVNHTTNKNYRGLNQFVLSFTAEENGWVNRWVTMKSAREKGWHIKQGESPQYIAFFKWMKKEDNNGDEYSFPLLRYYKVWSVSQLMEEVEIPEVVEFEPSDNAEKVINDMPNRPALTFGGNRAFYMPKEDRVTLPIKEAFKSSESYYATMFHELGHSTGHEKRLDRDGIVNFDNHGSEKYSMEELIAELTSAFICAETGINNVIENSTAYIQGWLKVLKDDRQMILTASAQAQKASDCILGVSWE